MKIFEDWKNAWPWFVMGAVNTLASFVIMLTVIWIFGFPAETLVKIFVFVCIWLLLTQLNKTGDTVLRRMNLWVDKKIADAYTNNGGLFAVVILLILLFLINFLKTRP